MFPNSQNKLFIGKYSFRIYGSTRTAIRPGLLILVSAALTGCSLLQGLSPSADLQVATSVAQTVAAQAPPASAQPATASPALPTLEPTFTSTPTQTPPASNTPEPTPTLTPTITPFVIYTPPVFPTLAPTAAITGCCTLRVRNSSLKVTYWIGTTRPYDGRFIQPLQYVEFYRSRYTWIEFYWCRRAFNNRWSDEAIDDWYDHWKNRDRYICYSREIYLDKNLEEVAVQ